MSLPLDPSVSAASPLRVAPALSWRDPRFLQLAVLFLYAIVAREIFHMDRPHAITLACCATALALDFTLGLIHFRVIRFPLSSLVIGLATSLLIDSRYPAVYLAAVTLAILSKAFITYRGFHLFNPANFGVVCALILAPNIATGMPALFGGYLAPSIVFFCLGVVTVLYARQSLISFSWLAGFLVFAFVRASLAGKSFLLMAMPILGPAFLLFTFHMISDPATSPRSKRHKIMYGIVIAALDAIFRYKQIPYGNFYALFLVSAGMPWMRDLEMQRDENFPRSAPTE
ncbi:MAG: RnfABCDGE type electron transport complex subunit D [Deltaproteobacteria bacterium]|nr:RnfABCDGE type electron transport complex subunit D [Deltaproteobacteria bacterium]